MFGLMRTTPKGLICIRRNYSTVNFAGEIATSRKARSERREMESRPGSANKSANVPRIPYGQLRVRNSKDETRSI